MVSVPYVMSGRLKDGHHDSLINLVSGMPASAILEYACEIENVDEDALRRSLVLMLLETPFKVNHLVFVLVHFRFDTC